MSHFVAIKVGPKKWKHIKVDGRVYLYIRQLEAYIQNPEKSKLKEVYFERFK